MKKNQFRLYRAICSISLLLFITVSCADRGVLSESRVRKLYPHARHLNDTARYLAGMKISDSSPLAKVCQNPRYLQYQKSIEKLWERYQTAQLMKIELWQKKNLKNTNSAQLFYPFSGPDILNALAFFPGKKSYNMIGLELPGPLPDPGKITGARAIGGLWPLRRALRTILSLNLFRTLEMQADFRAETFHSVTGIMAFFLARYGYEILSVQQITFLKKGAIQNSENKRVSGSIPGVRFIFRKGKGAPLQRADYWSCDLSDGSLAHKAQFLSYLKKMGRVTTFIKSASYLLSYTNFKTVRDFILNQSDTIVEGDSGIPYKFFKKSEWDITHYGHYRILKMFKDRYQADYSQEVKKLSRSLLPFSFDYGFVPAKSNLMIARSKKGKN